jgi:hypothetical protein
VSLAANAHFYAEQSTSLAAVGTLQGQVASLQSQLADVSNRTSSAQSEVAELRILDAELDSQVDSLRNQTLSLQNENSRLQSEQETLRTLLDQLSQGKVPALLVTRLGASDMRYTYTGSDIRLYISGEVWNVGTEPARNSRLHVTLYQGVVVAKDTYIELGTINGGSFVDLARNIYYEGVALTRWTIVPEHD